MKKLIFIVSYNAENHIIGVLERISEAIMADDSWHILIIDDCSTDETISQIESYARGIGRNKILLKINDQNKGYGGNQKLGYQYAINFDFDLVVLLHGDGQYAPEYLEAMILPISKDRAGAVLGSRMIYKWNALKGGMPLYKWIGNIILSSLQNLILNTHFSEFHTGYRAYSVEALKAIEFAKNSDYYDFDTEIILQLLAKKVEFAEIAIPTFYGSEVSYVNGFKYAYLILKASISHRIKNV